MDAPVFSARPHSESPTLALSRAESSRAADAAAAPVQCGTFGQDRPGGRQAFFVARRVAGSCQPAIAVGPSNHLLTLSVTASNGDSAKPTHRTPHPPPTHT